MRRSRWIALATLAAACQSPTAPPTGPRVQLHAHNDYLHPRPLQQALAAGFTSVEADVFLVDGELRVGHERWQLRPGRTLTSLYLEPLHRGWQADGQFAPGVTQVQLLVDIKADAAAVHRALAAELSRYRDMLTRFRDDGVTCGAVTVILSGSRPRELVAAEPERLCAIDGRLADLTASPPPSPFLVPLVSDSWSRVCDWDGRDEPLPAERVRLRDLVAQAHAQGRQLRFWGIPDRIECWRELAEAGVDWIGSDRLRDCAAWYRDR